MEPVRWSGVGASAGLEIHLPTAQPGTVLRCRLVAAPRDVPQLQRYLHRALNHRHSGWALSGMMLLLAVCGWVAGGEDGARRALAEATPHTDAEPISPAEMWRAFGARPLRRAEMPALFDVLSDICRRAWLRRIPDLYYVATPQRMNAYAFGGPEGSAITLTDGLLRGMTLREIAAILAHEVAHIRNNDAGATSWAAALQRAIVVTSHLGLTSLQGRPGAWGRGLRALLAGAPVIGELLCLALSRIRELDADALALELIGDSQALIAALDRLEHHHTGTRVGTMAACEDDATRYLRSHPATAERVGTLQRLAC
jgi:heat shock protein HtpX